MNKTTTHYFDSARNLPLAMSFSQIESLVAEVGVPYNPPNKGWGFKNYLIMTTSIITISAALFLSVSTSNESSNQSLKPETEFKKEVKEIVLTKDSIRKSKRVSIIDKDGEEKEIKVKKIGKNTYQEVEDSNLKVIEPKIKLISQTNTDKKQELIQDIDEQNNIEEPMSLFESSGLDVLNEPMDLFDEPVDLFISNEDTSAINGTSKTITKSIELDNITWFKLNNNQGNIVIKNGDSNEAQLKAIITIEGKTKEDEQKALQDFDLNFEQKKDQLGVAHNWEGNDIGSCLCWSNSKKNKIRLSNGESVRLKKVKIEYELSLPSSVNLELKNHYADITVPNREGELKAVLFKGDLYAGNIKGDLNLTEKYGDAIVESAKNVAFNLYKGKLELGTSNDIKGKLSYSEFALTKANNLDLTAFQSNATINEISEKLKSNFRYGDLTIKHKLDEMELTAFQAKVKASSIDKSNLNLSYSKFEMIDGNEINLEKAFQSKIYANEIDQINGKANYSPIEIKKIFKGMDLATFQGSIDVRSIERDFTKVNLNTRFTNVDLIFDPLSSYNFETKTSFTSVNMPTNVKNLDVNAGQSNVKSHLKGQVDNGANGANSLVFIESFQGKLNLQ